MNSATNDAARRGTRERIGARRSTSRRASRRPHRSRALRRRRARRPRRRRRARAGTPPLPRGKGSYRTRSANESRAPGRRSGPSIHPPATALACGAAGAGPQGTGARRGDQQPSDAGCRPSFTFTSKVELLRSSSSSTESPGFLLPTIVAQLFDRRDAHAVGLHDDVAAERPRHAGKRHFLRSGVHTRGRRPRVAAHGADEQALLHRQPEQRRDTGCDRARVDPDERMLDDALRDQLRRDVLHGVDRDGEADPDVAVAAARCLDLRVDADHLSARVEEWAARVAVIERGVGLDHVVDRRAVRRDDAALPRADDAGRDRAVLTERIPDRDDGVADPYAVRVSKLERRERARLHAHLQDGDIGRRIAPDNARRKLLVVREAHVNLLRALDDVVVRDDVAGLVDDEAGSRAPPPSRRSSRRSRTGRGTDPSAPRRVSSR